MRRKINEFHLIIDIINNSNKMDLDFEADFLNKY